MRKWRMAAALGLAMAGVPVMARAQTAAPQAPALTITRYDEDWSVLADPAARTGRWTDALKYIPLGDDIYLTTGTEVRLRNEDYRNNLWGGAPAPDDSYLWLRAMPYADLHAGNVRAFVQPIIAYAEGVSPAAGPVDETRVDLLQGFAEATLPLGGDSVSLRAGRQMLSLGTERLVGTRYGPNVPLAFDGERMIVKTGIAEISLFSVRPVQPGMNSFDDEQSREKALWGAYATLPDLWPGIGLDIYYLGYRNRDATYGTRTGREQRHSFGLRSFGDIDNRHWNIEGVVQTGQFDGGPIFAWTLGTEVGQRFPDAPLFPDATLRFNIVSGDTNAHDDRLGTFNALFPKGKYFGELSPVGPYNIISLNPHVALDLGNDFTAGIGGMLYWRYARADGIYDVPGNLVRSPGNASSRFIGKEIELTLDWQATPELDLSTSVSAFAPGGFIRETGTARTIGMLGLEANFRF
ncbi:MAG: alginate export family protein [Parvibaculaceae bacterium]|nr:alginate export family protein [Parvibaculaceae bacterium]